MKGFRERLRCLGSDERGALLVEALFSAVVVAFAFTATTLAFNSSTSSATRDISKSGGLTVAQGQLEYLRSVGQNNITELVDLDNTTRTISYGGVDYTITYRAYYVDSMGGGNTNSCGSFASSGGSSAQYIYLKATVNYEVPTNAPPISMESYFAPEGGSSQSSTGTLKVYVLGVDGTPFSTFPSTVNLKLNAATVDTQTLNANGCVLFTGLARGTYTISIPDNTLQDLYMTSGGNTFERKVQMPARGAIIQKVQLATPITVTPTFKARTGPTTDVTIAPTSSNPYVKDTQGNNPTIGMWVAQNSSITQTGYADYTLNPGKVFMPHYQPNPTSMASQLYPDPAGYSTYAGACTVNNPAPANLKPLVGTSWTAPELWLTKLRAIAGVTGNATQPTPNAATYYYWNQTFASATVKVKLVGDSAGNSPEETDCGPRDNLYNTWVTVGTINVNNGALSDALQALPTGEYEACLAITYNYSRGEGYRRYSWNPWTMRNIETLADTQYVAYTPFTLGYRAEPVTKAISLASPTPVTPTPCG